MGKLNRYIIFALSIALSILFLALIFVNFWFVIPAIIFGALTILGIIDITQPKHAILRNYPIIGHMRFLFEGIRPEIRQYLIESDQDEEPFSRDERSIVYQRAKDVEDKRPFGTREHVYDAGYAWLTHSIQPKHIENNDFRITIGGPDCSQPYEASIYNISAMSFGALSGNAIKALNTGAKTGGFAHNTGEGGISRHHKSGGGDIVYQIGSGYFGCCNEDGSFNPEKFSKQAAEPQVKMIELKLSQGAKPGHGGVLPDSKVTAEIAEARGVEIGTDCVSPASHPAFSTPIEMMQFIKLLREKSGGKPIGFKLCIGHRREFMCLVKAMLETGIKPDYIVVDGKEGGTGAAPLEFSNHVGMPLIEGLDFVHNTLRGAGIREDIRIGASGKLVTAFEIVRALSMGADWVNSARGFMFAIGCIQAQACHTNCCPVGVATQDPIRQRALDVGDKSQRVANFHANTLHAIAEMTGAAGLDHPSQFLPRHFMQRDTNGDMLNGDQAYPELPMGFLLRDEDCGDGYLMRWNRANANSFAPLD